MKKTKKIITNTKASVEKECKKIIATKEYGPVICVDKNGKFEGFLKARVKPEFEIILRETKREYDDDKNVITIYQSYGRYITKKCEEEATEALNKKIKRLPKGYKAVGEIIKKELWRIK